MNNRPVIEEFYQKGNEVIYYVKYESTTGNGYDEVLQHKIMGSETAHITLHPDGEIHFRKKRTKIYLENAIKQNMIGFEPRISENIKQFIFKVSHKPLNQ
jgi:hypothetical protein